MKAGAFADGVMTFFGLMLGEAIGINQTPGVALAYVVVGGVLVACGKFATVSAPAAERVIAAEGGLVPAAE